ncbi:hypothetical protein C8R45DRAFT_931997 [Mycena sanguinolenta]|nr:hypothetical protein C8R45DRAFT_931997 [Mycena sanguinolenta]
MTRELSKRAEEGRGRGRSLGGRCRRDKRQAKGRRHKAERTKAVSSGGAEGVLSSLQIFREIFGRFSQKNRRRWKAKDQGSWSGDRVWRAQTREKHQDQRKRRERSRRDALAGILTPETACSGLHEFTLGCGVASSGECSSLGGGNSKLMGRRMQPIGSAQRHALVSKLALQGIPASKICLKRLINARSAAATREERRKVGRDGTACVGRLPLESLLSDARCSCHRIAESSRGTLYGYGTGVQLE